MKGKVQNTMGLYDRISNPAWEQRVGKAFQKKYFIEARRMNKNQPREWFSLWTISMNKDLKSIEIMAYLRK